MRMGWQSGTGEQTDLFLFAPTRPDVSRLARPAACRAGCMHTAHQARLSMLAGSGDALRHWLGAWEGWE